MNWQNIKYGIYALVAIYFISTIFFSGDSSSDTVEVEVEYPTEGLITTVKEVETDLFKIEDEVPVADTLDSRIIANYMDATSDTFTLEEARLIEANGGTGRRGSVVRSAMMGYFGYMMIRNMGRMGHMPRAGAYTDPKAFNKSQAAGNKVKSSSRKVTRTRPSSGKSGYGSGKSTRSYGG